MAAALVVLAAFVVARAPARARGVSPLVTMSLFRKRAFSAGLACALVFFAGMIGLMLAFSLYLQLGLGFGAAHAGVGLHPVVARHRGRRGPRRRAARRPASAARRCTSAPSIMLAGVLGMLAVVATTGARHDGLADRRARARRPAPGWACCSPRCSTSCSPGVEEAEIGSASGVLNATQQLSGAIGIAAIGTVFFSVLASARHPAPRSRRRCGSTPGSSSSPPLWRSCSRCAPGRTRPTA